MRRLIEFVALRQAFSLQTLGKWDCARLKAVPRALLLVRLTDCLWAFTAAHATSHDERQQHWECPRFYASQHLTPIQHTRAIQLRARGCLSF